MNPVGVPAACRARSPTSIVGAAGGGRGRTGAGVATSAFASTACSCSVGAFRPSLICTVALGPGVGGRAGASSV